jgi:hypothetical protein
LTKIKTNTKTKEKAPKRRVQRERTKEKGPKRKDQRERTKEKCSKRKYQRERTKDKDKDYKDKDYKDKEGHRQRQRTKGPKKTKIKDQRQR